MLQLLKIVTGGRASPPRLPGMTLLLARNPHSLGPKRVVMLGTSMICTPWVPHHCRCVCGFKQFAAKTVHTLWIRNQSLTRLIQLSLMMTVMMIDLMLLLVCSAAVFRVMCACVHVHVLHAVLTIAMHVSVHCNPLPTEPVCSACETGRASFPCMPCRPQHAHVNGHM
jgi:hypothetical protein